jgi:hypothetical protein
MQLHIPCINNLCDSILLPCSIRVCNHDLLCALYTGAGFVGRRRDGGVHVFFVVWAYFVIFTFVGSQAGEGMVPLFIVYS